MTPRTSCSHIVPSLGWCRVPTFPSCISHDVGISGANIYLRFRQTSIQRHFTFLFISALRKAPGMSHILMSFPSCAFNVAVISKNSLYTVGLVASPGTDFFHCFRPSTHIRPYALPYLLTFINIRDLSASRLCSLVRCSAYS